MQNNLPKKDKLPWWHLALRVLSQLEQGEWIDSTSFTKLVNTHYPEYFAGGYKDFATMFSYLGKWKLVVRKNLSLQEKKEIRSKREKGHKRGRCPSYFFQITDKGRRYVKDYHKYRGVCPTCGRLIYKKTSIFNKEKINHNIEQIGRADGNNNTGDVHSK